MIILLKILLYLQLISGPGTYRESELLVIESANQPAISAFQNDPELLGTIPEQYETQAGQIIVIDDSEDM